MLKELNGSAQMLVVKSVITYKHYPDTLKQKEVLVPIGFLNDVLKVVSGIIQAEQGQGETGKSQKEFHDSDTKG